MVYNTGGQMHHTVLFIPKHRSMLNTVIPEEPSLTI
jgi:hypothetical protein